mmetsp:Transcript_264/g.145  ORF Transcript_264/g.145 Transcript_264/m.145 type:complete len:80 (-) Transcript_264:169-408(-)
MRSRRAPPRPYHIRAAQSFFSMWSSSFMRSLSSSITIHQGMPLEHALEALRIIPLEPKWLRTRPLRNGMTVFFFFVVQY